MIRGTNDESTPPEKALALFHAAPQPKRLCEVSRANHRFDGHQPELFQALRSGLGWIASMSKLGA